MKKLLTTFLSVVLCLMTAFSVSACADNNDEGGNGGNGNTLPSVSQVLSGIKTKLESQQNITVTAEISDEKDGSDIDGQKLLLKAKKTADGYDTYSKTEGPGEDESGAKITAISEAWAVGGTTVRAESIYKNGETTYVSTQETDENQRVDMVLNLSGRLGTSYDETEAMLTQAIDSFFAEDFSYEGFTVAAAEGGYTLTFALDYAAQAEAFAAAIEAARTMPLGDVLNSFVGESMGTQNAAALKAELSELFSETITVPQFFGKINGYLGDGVLFELVGTVESAGITAQALHAICGEMGLAMAAPAENATLYEYLTGDTLSAVAAQDLADVLVVIVMQSIGGSSGGGESGGEISGQEPAQTYETQQEATGLFASLRALLPAIYTDGAQKQVTTEEFIDPVIDGLLKGLGITPPIANYMKVLGSLKAEKLGVTVTATLASDYTVSAVTVDAGAKISVKIGSMETSYTVADIDMQVGFDYGAVTVALPAEYEALNGIKTVDYRGKSGAYVASISADDNLTGYEVANVTTDGIPALSDELIAELNAEITVDFAKKTVTFSQAFFTKLAEQYKKSGMTGTQFASVGTKAVRDNGFSIYSARIIFTAA